MSHLHYLGVLGFIGACGVGINFFFATGLRKRWRTFFITDLLVILVYSAWDSWAIYKRNWYFDLHQILGVRLFFNIPIEEILFFLIVPFTTISTYLALSKLTGWRSTNE